MADYHVRRTRMPSSGSDDFEEESLDPRIQVELEKLNKASEEINRLELELDDARASFRQTLSESTQKLDVLAKNLGSCVEKARPYYDARVKAKEAHLETQRAALRFERACSMHEAAKEMVQLAEQGYMRREQPSDPAWQEMLNHATMKVNEAEKERNESEQEHQRTMIRFKVSEDQVQRLQKDLKRSIAKSKPYFEMKARFNQVMEEHKHKVSVLEEDVSSAKSLYSTALRSLEAISDEIHRQRLERRQQQQLGVRGAGVGAECPLPPPSWEKGSSMDGRDGCQSLDPLGVIKISSTVSFGGSGSQRRRSRNLSGESCHGTEMVEEDGGGQEAGRPQEQSTSENCAEKGTEEHESEREEASGSRVCSPASDGSSPKDKVLIPGDPLGVIPPTYTTSSRSSHPSKAPSPSSSSSISHPAFSSPLSPHSSRSAQLTHPMVAVAQQHSQSPALSRTKSVSNKPEAFVSPSVVYPNPEQARRQSYRRAVESSEKSAEDSGAEDEGMIVEGRSRDVFVQESRQRSYSSPVDPSDPRTRSPPHAIPRRSPAIPDALADGRKHGSAPEKSAILTSQHAVSESEGTEAMDDSPSLMRRKQKLQGLILRIDPAMDPLRHFEPPARNPPGPSAQKTILSPTPLPHHPTPSPTPAPTTQGEKDIFTPTPTHPTPGFLKPAEPPSQSSSDYSINKPIIRSASSVSTAGSERSETEFSEIESVSATQSPTKPRSRLLNVPASVETVEDSSDTESLASTGPMLDDEQVEFLTMDFSDMNLEKEEYSSNTLPSHLKRNSWSRMSLPPRLSYLEGFLARAKRTSGEFDASPTSPDCMESPREEGEDTLVSRGSESESAGDYVDKRVATSSSADCIESLREEEAVDTVPRAAEV